LSLAGWVFIKSSNWEKPENFCTQKCLKFEKKLTHSKTALRLGEEE
jgi:hypothetical protein